MSKLAINNTSLTAIGDAIREKTKTTDLLTLEAMPAAIRSISGGGEVVFPDFEIKHDSDPNIDLQYLNAQGRYTELINFLVDHGSKVVVKGGQRMNYAFHESDYCKLEMDGTYGSEGQYYSEVGNTYSSEMFNKYKGTQLPKVKGYNFADLSKFFYQAYNLTTETVEEFINNNKFTNYNGSLYRLGECFYQNHFIRHIPDNFINGFYSSWNSTNVYAFNLYNNFADTWVLDSLYNLPVPIQPQTSNRSTYFLANAMHLKGFTFKSGQSWNATNQIINLAALVGWSDRSLVNFGLPAEKEIKDAATYALYKDDPDAWTQMPEYSRYNHDSAVETINSLPNSTKGTNTIKFYGAAGSLTDGGAINTLTADEIAIATNKGWTVSIE